MIRFIDALGRTLSKPRLREIGERMELTPEELTYFLARCYDQLIAEQIEHIHFITLSRQRTLIHYLNNKIYLWMSLNFAKFLSTKEMVILNAVLKKFNLPPTSLN